MRDIRISILICTLPSRVGDELPRIISKLNSQSVGLPVEILYLGDNKKRSVGHKRNDLLKLAQGDYICFVDDDDDVSDNYVSSILDYIDNNSGVDVFSPAGVIDRDGSETLQFDFDLGHGRNYNKAGIAHRSPNHLCVIKKQLIEDVQFPDKSLSEDHAFASLIRKKLQREVKMPDVCYYYNFSYSGTETQHNLRRIKKL